MGRVSHFEIHAGDPERAVEFYRSVFGWEIKKWDGPVDYWLITTGPGEEPGIDGAILRRPGSEPTAEAAVNSFVSTIQVDSIDDAEKAVTAAGGEQVMPRDEIEGVGQLSYFKDPEGNIFGILQPPAA